MDELIIVILLETGLQPQELHTLRIADLPAHHGKPHLHVPYGVGCGPNSPAMPAEVVAASRDGYPAHPTKQLPAVTPG